MDGARGFNAAAHLGISIKVLILDYMMVELKVTVKSDFFENNLLLQSDVIFDSESNGRNFSSLAPPGGEKKIFSIFFYKMTSRVGVFSDFLSLNESL